MPTIQEIMDQYLGPAPVAPNIGLSEQDALEVGAAVQNGKGNDFRSEVQRDLATLSPLEILDKYGPNQGQALIAQRGRGEAGYMQKRFATKTEFDDANDIVTGGFTGAVRGIGGTLGFLGGLASDRVGNAINEFTNDLAEQGGKGISRGGAVRKEAYELRRAVSQEESEVQYERDLQTESPTMAGLRKVGRDVVNSWNDVTQDGSTVLDIAAEGLGSLVGGVPVIKGAQFVGKAGQMIAARAGSARAVKLLEDAATPVAIGLQGAGGSYSQVSNEIMAMSEKDLSQSEEYLALRHQDGLSHEEAQIALANRAGLEAGALTLPFAALTGKLVDRFEANPFKSGNLRSFVRNTAAETLEETLQGGQANIVSNLALKQADPDRSLVDGLGEEMVVGAIGGAGAAGLAQGPGTAGRTAADAVRGTVGLAADGVNAVVDAAKARGAAVRDQIASASPSSDSNTSSGLNAAIVAIQSALTPAPVVETAGEVSESSGDAAPTQIDPRLQQLFDAATYNEESDLDEGVSDTVRQALAGSENKFGAMERLISLIETAEDGSEEQLSAARTLRGMYAQSGAALRTAVDAAEEAFPEDSPVGQAIREGAAAFKTLGSNAKVVNAMKNTVPRVLEQAVKTGAAKVDDTTDVTTPEGRAKVQNAVAVAELKPAEADLDTTNRVLRMAESGKISLSNEQRAALMSSAALLQAEREALEAAPADEKAIVKLVHREAITDRDIDPEGQLPSLSTHVRNVVEAYRAGNIEEAKANLRELMLFAEHMQNKVDALNRHYENGGGPKGTGEVYNSLIRVGTDQKKRWVTSKKPIGVAPNSESSVRFAQRVGAEAEMLAKVANNLAQIFPDLGLEEITAVALNPALQGDAKAIARRNWMAVRDGNPLPGTQSARTSQEPTSTPTPVAGRSEAAQERRQAAPEVGAERQASVTEDEESQTEDTKTEDDSNVSVAEPAVESREETESEDSPAPEAAETAQPEGGDTSTETDVADREIAATDVDDQEAEADDRQDAPAEEAVEPEATTAAATEVETDTDPYDLAPRFPNLVGQQAGSKIKNLFLKAFRRSEKSVSIVTGSEDPINMVNDWIQGSNEEPGVKGAYELFLGNAMTLSASMNKALREYLQKPYSKSDQRTNLDVLVQDGKLNLFTSGRVLNIIERVDGKIRYNPELLDIASMAALQWMLHMPRFKYNLNEYEDLYAILGITEENAYVLEGREEELMGMFNEGASLIGSSRSLGRMIRDYWNVVPQKGADIGVVEGITEGLAKEMLEAMVRQGMLSVSEPVTKVFDAEAKFPEGEGPRGQGRGLQSPYVYRVNRLAEETLAVRDNVDLIENTVKSEPDPLYHVGAAPKKVATNLLHSKTKMSKRQRKAVEARQNNAFKANLGMIDLLFALGEDGVQYAFGGGVITEDMNEAHATKLSGQNTTMKAAFAQLKELWPKILAHAKANDLDPANVPVFYEYVFNQMNRLQMLGGSNPQNSKLLREAMLATRTTLDLSKDAHYSAFMLAIGQHLGGVGGIKVDQKSVAEIVEATKVLMASEQMAPAVALMLDWNERRASGNTEITAEEIDVIKTALGKEMSPVAVHSLMEYARFLTAGKDALSQFETSLYFEADGKTNGPGNALVLFTPGEFTGHWIDNFNRIGGSVGVSKAVPLNELVQVVSKDLYNTTSDHMQQRLVEAVTAYLGDGTKKQVLSGALRQVLTMLDLFVGSDVVFDGENFEFKRGFSKNPLTVSLYGSQDKGISNKITKAILDGMYEKMSQGLQRMAADESLTPEEALFPGFPEKAEQFKLAYREMFGHDVSLTKAGMRKLRLRKAQTEGMRSLIEQQIVSQLRAAIGDTMGQPVQDAMLAIRQATQMQSIMAVDMYNTLVQAKMATKKEQNPDWRPDDFLSQEDLDEIANELDKLGITIDFGDQNLNLVSSERADSNTRQFSLTLNGNLSTPAFAFKPINIGVKGIPGFVISAADGMMMQIHSSEFDVEGTSDVFDGLNVSLDNLEGHGRNINQAVFKAWQRNPLHGLVKAYAKFRATADTKNLSKEAYSAIRYALFQGFEGKVTNQMIQAELDKLGRTLEVMALRLDARIETLKEFGVSVDHMAGTSAPFFNDGRSLEGIDDPKAKAKVLNETYFAKLEELKQKRKWALETNLAPEVDALATRHETGARVIENAMIKPIAKALGATGWQMDVLGDTVETLVQEGYRIVAGNPDQIRAWMNAEGIPTDSVEDLNAPGSETKTNGLTLPSERVILIVNPSSEVLVHEMIHGATIAVVDAYYNGTLESGFHPMKKAAAIKRIELLMEQFLGLDVSQESEETQAAYANAVEAILQYRFTDPAAALNEFMAWGLSNQHLANLMSKTKATPLALMTRKLIDLIKRVLFGNKSAAVLDDMLTNLRFNTKIVAVPSPTVVGTFRETALYHSESYGNDQRLLDLQRTLDRKVMTHIDAHLRRANLDPNNPNEAQFRKEAVKRLEDEIRGSGLSRSLVPGEFRMTAQEKATFEVMVATMSSAVELDPNALTRASEIFVHVTQQLEVDHFRRNPETYDPDDEMRANRMYDFLMGYLNRSVDDRGRGSEVPVFVALATVQSDVRKALAQIALPETAKSFDGTFDGWIEGVAESAMDKLSDKISGLSGQERNVREVVDALVDRMAKTAADSKSDWQLMAAKPGNAVDKLNEVVAQGIERTSKAVDLKSTEILAKTKNPFVKGAATTARVLAGIANRDIGNRLAETIMMDLSQMPDLPKAIFDGINNFVGRTINNSQVFDLIKRVNAVVQQQRQQYREHLPQYFAKKFSRVLEDAEWAALFRAMGKTDITALRGRYNKAEIIGMLADSSKVSQEIAKLETELKTLQPRMFQTLQNKSQQLATFMVTGVTGNMLLTNAAAISDLVGMRKPKNYEAAQGQEDLIDALVTLYALNQTDTDTLSSVAGLVGSEQAGVEFLAAYMWDQRKRERAKTTGNARYNHYKGYLPQDKKEAATLIVARDADFVSLREQGFERVGVYSGSDLDPRTESLSYYYSPVSQRAAYNQGIMQTVHHTASGVDRLTGRTFGPRNAGSITFPHHVSEIYKNRFQESATENLLPRWNGDGDIVSWERTVTPQQLALLENEEHIGKAVANMQGRQAEEHLSMQVNDQLLGALYRMWDQDLKNGNEGAYVDLFDEDVRDKDPVLRDTYNSMPGHLIMQIDSMFDGKFPIRRDMIDDAVGYRDASVRNLWDKKSRWSPAALDTIKSTLIGTFGADAYNKVVKAESVIQNVALDIRLLISVKSMVVPMANMVWNVVQLMTRGVPLVDIKRGVGRKVSEINDYLKSRERLIDIQAELTAESDPRERLRLKKEAQVIESRHRTMSIWPLIEAGEFTSISDGMLKQDDISLREGKLSAYFESLAGKLPKQAQTLAKYGLVARDTALFKGLQRTVEYGDFVAKAILYDDLTKRGTKTSAEALGMISEEFVHYDRHPGRDRGYVEQMGLAWFWNFKIRSTKIALSMLRNNPVHALLTMNMPFPDLFGAIGSPLTDNAISAVMDGKAQSSIGLDMVYRAPGLIPGVNFAPV